MKVVTLTTVLAVVLSVSVDAKKSPGTQENVCSYREDGTFLADSNSCSSFIVCYGGKPVSQDCDAGSYFDTKQLYCMPDTKNVCTPSDCKENGAYLAHPTNCALFYICNAGKLVEQSCGQGSYFDSKNLFCKPDVDNICWPSTPAPEPEPEPEICTCEGGYKQGDLVGSGANCSSFFRCDMGKLIPDDCGLGNYFDNNTNNCVRDINGVCGCKEQTCVCQGGYEEGDFVENEDSCYSYYICMHGELVPQSCGTGNYYNKASKRCDRDYDGKCWPKCEEGERVANETSCFSYLVCKKGELVAQTCGDKDYFDSESKKCVRDDKNICRPRVCPGGLSEGDRIANETSCFSYLVCKKGELVAKTCGDKDYFDSESKKCVPDDKNICRPRDCDCEDGSKDGDLVANSANCSSYFICFEGKLVPHDCGYGNYFDKESKNCVRDDDNICRPRVCPGGLSEGDRIADETSCFSYLVCKKGELVAQTCGDKDYFDNESKKCVRDDKNICRPRVCPGGLSEGDRIANETSCFSYLVCKKGELVAKTCGDKDYFDNESKKCVRDDKNICRPRVCPGGLSEGDRIADETSCFSYLVCKKGELVAKTCGDKDYFDSESKKCVPDDKNICRPRDCDCEDGSKDGDLVANSANCSSYFICFEGKLVPHDCGYGNYFDKESKNCVRDDDNICRPRVCPGGLSEGDRIADETSCFSYLVCKKGELVAQTCGDKDYFDNESKKCVRDDKNICRPRVCPGGLSEGDRIANETSCFSYLVCKKGELVAKTCGDKDYFDNESKKCVRDDKNICRPRVCPGGLSEGDRIADENSCFSYLVCKKGELVAKTCGDKDYFDNESKKCVRDDKNICRPRVCPGGLSEGDRIADETSCFSYLVCKKGELVAKTCGDKDYFDNESKKCVRDDKNICRPRVCPGGLLEGDRIADETSCFSYLVCKKGELVAKTCGDKDYFDSESKKCVPDDKNICRPRDCDCEDGSKDGDLVANSANCSSYFICFEGKLVPHDCGYGNYFDKESKNCVRDDDNICRPRVCPGGLSEGDRIADETSCFSYLVCKKGELVAQTCGDKDYFDNESKKCVRDDKNICRPRVCPGGLSEGDRIANETSCFSYLVCKKGELVAKTCGDKDYFDNESKKCVRDDKNICRPRVCPGGLAEGDRIADETSCFSYLVCKKGKLVAKTCGDKDYFDSESKKCVPDDKNICRPRDCDCEDGSKDGDLVANSANCSSYFICFEGKLVPHDCGYGNYFDKESKNCVRDDDNICRPRVCPGGLSEGDRIADETSCFSYLVCKKGELVAKTCGDKDYFDNESKKCVRDDKNICRPRVCPGGLSEGDRIADETSCFSYLVCKKGELVAKTCGDKDYFDNESKKCVRDDKNICRPRVCPGGLSEGDRITDETSCFSYLVCKKGELVAKTCGDKDYFDNESKKCVRDDKNICRPRVCPGGLSEGDRIADETSCFSYLVCKKGELVAKTCGDKDYFDNESKKCVRDDKNICRPRVCPGGLSEGDRIADENSCFSYLVCKKGELVAKTCGDKDYFDNESKKCVRDDKNICRPRVCPGGLSEGDRITDETSCFSYLVCKKGELVAKTCGDKDYFDNESKKCVRDDKNICRPRDCDCEDGSKDGDLVANSANCSSYFICFEGKLVPHDCGYGNYFDKESKNCVRDDDNICRPRVCPGGLSEGDRIADETSCFSYLVCKKGELVAKTCGDKDYFDNESKKCVRDDKNICRPRVCPGGLSEGDRIADETSCFSYLVCKKGELVAKTCGDKDYFDKESKKCVRDDKNICRPRVCPGGLSEGDRIANKTSCFSYLVCTKGELIPGNCGFGNYFDTNTNTCIQDLNGVCWKNEKPCECLGGYEDGQLVSHNTTCYMFYICYGGELIEDSCGYGNYFDAKLGSCVRDVHGKCWKQETSSTSTTTTTTTTTKKPTKRTTTSTSTTTTKKPTKTTTTSTSTTSTKKPTTTTTTKSTTTTSTPEGPCTCPGGYEEGQFVPHPTKCYLFYMCYNSKLVEQSCGYGNYFDALSQSCVLDINGICWSKSTTTPSTTTTRSTTTTSTRKPTTTTSTTTPSTTTTRSTTTTSTRKPTTTTRTSTTTPSTTTSRSTTTTSTRKPTTTTSTTTPSTTTTRSTTTTSTRKPTTTTSTTTPSTTTTRSTTTTSTRKPTTTTSTTTPSTTTTRLTTTTSTRKPTTTTRTSTTTPSTTTTRSTTTTSTRKPTTTTSTTTTTPTTTTSTTTSISPTTPCTCPGGHEEGDFVPHPKSCYKFFICSQGKLSEISCGEGNYFDKETKSCTLDTTGICWPKPDPCECPKGLNEGQFIADPESCFKYSICHNGALIGGNCGTGNLFNNSTKVCEPDTAGVCWPKEPCDCPNGLQEGERIDDPDSCYMYLTCSQGNLVKGSCGTGNYFNNETKTCKRDANNCCWPCTNGEMIADIEECDKFSICNDGKFVEQQCGTGYYFDVYQKYCVRDVNGTCWKVQPPSNTCQGAKDGTLLPDPTACEKYFICQNNKPVAQQCGMGNLFNSTTLSCVHDTCGECWTKIPNVCANKPTGTFLPNAEHCDQFIVCHENHAIVQQCGSGNWFNPKTLLCEQDLYAKCINVCQNTKGTTQLPHPNCNEFYLCQNGLTKAVRTCLKGTNYDAIRGICLASATCEETLCSSSPNGVNYPVRNDPSSFYTCYNKKPVKLSCPSGTSFDSERLICIPDTGLCIGQINGFTIGSKKNSNAYYVCKDNAAIFEQCPAHTVFDADKGICVHALRKRVVNNICSTEADGTMLSGNVCNKFYLCLDGESIEQNCGAYASFDPKLRSCTFNATCFNLKEICGKSGDTEKFPDARHANSYVACKRGVATLEKCPKNTVYSHDIGSCVPSQMAIQKNELLSLCSQVPDKTITPALDCRKFYICSNRVAMLQQCAIDQLFNLTTGTCQADTKRQCWMRSETLRKSSFLRIIDETDDYKIVCQHCQNHPEPQNHLENEVSVDEAGIALSQSPRSTGCFSENVSQVRQSEKSCTEFYHCIDNQWKLQHCPLGTFFNSKLQTCTADSSSCGLQSAANGSCKTNTTKPDDMNCGSYYICLGDKWNHWHCAEGTYFNQTHGKCINGHYFNGTLRACMQDDSGSYADNIGHQYVERARKSNPNNCTAFEILLDNEWISVNCAAGFYFDIYLNKCLVNSGECSVNGLTRYNCTDKTLKPSFNNLSHFYQCSNDKWHQESCLQNFKFDLDLKKCVVSNSSSNDLITFSECNNFTRQGRLYFPHETDCTKFYFCEDGTRIEGVCSKGRFFNSKSQRCKHDTNVCDPERMTHDSICQTESNGTFHMNPSNCSTFFTCVDRSALLTNCPQGKYFDPETGICQSDKSKCSLRPRCDDADTGQYPHETYCSVYYTCIGGQLKAIACEEDFLFDNVLNRCIPDIHHLCIDGHLKNSNYTTDITAVTSTIPDSISCIGRQGEIMLDPQNCNNFYVCINEELRHEKCFDGHFFNITRNSCSNITSNEICQNITETSIICSNSDSKVNYVDQSDCRKYYQCNDDGEFVSKKCRNGESFDNLLGFCKQNDGTCLIENGQRVGACAGKHGMVVADADNCLTFYTCINGQKISRNCQLGEYFDKSTRKCEKDVNEMCTVLDASELN